jgi:hypothetical protein
MFKISCLRFQKHFIPTCYIVEMGPTKIEKKFVKSKTTLKLEKDSMM